MKWKRLEANASLVPIRLVLGFFEAFFTSLIRVASLIKKERKPLRESHFLESLHFFLHDWPKNFWKFPTAIEIGRLPGTLLNFVFRKGDFFERKNKGFTLIEMVVSITIFAAMLVLAFESLGNISIFRSFVSDRADIAQELYYAVETAVQTMKNGGDVDYEEYYNRGMVGTGTANGHYVPFSSYGNASSGTGYGAYARSFWNGNDDLGTGPEAFSSGGVGELYLIHTTAQGVERVYLRRNVVSDPEAPASATCDTAVGTGSGCLGSFEILKLVGKDDDFNGTIDTWVCAPGFSCSGPSPSHFPSMKEPNDENDGWVALFPRSVDVRSVSFFPFPRKDYRLAWNETDPNVNVAPSVRFSIRLGFAWEKRKKLKLDPEVSTTTTVSLDRY